MPKFRNATQLRPKMSLRKSRCETRRNFEEVGDDVLEFVLAGFWRQASNSKLFNYFC